MSKAGSTKLRAVGGKPGAAAQQEGEGEDAGPKGAPKSKRLQQTQAQVDEVVGIMKMNIEKVLERDQKLSQLDDRADALQEGASQFEKSASTLKNKMWLKNLKMIIIMVIIVLILLFVLYLKFGGKMPGEGGGGEVPGQAPAGGGEAEPGTATGGEDTAAEAAPPVAPAPPPAPDAGADKGGAGP